MSKTQNSSNVIETIPWNDPINDRYKVDWLDQIQVLRIYKEEKDPYEEVIIHLELDLALRRCEISRILLSDIDYRNEILKVRGKRNKNRPIPFSIETPQVFERWMKYRDDLFTQYPKAKDPKALVIIPHQGNFNPIGRTAIDSRVRAVSERVGFHFSNHTLRRTWARYAWQCGESVETLSMILGHKDTKTTLEYIGAPIDQIRAGMMNIYQKRRHDMEQYEKSKEIISP